MKIEGLKIYDLIYVASPYTLYPGGTDKAFKDISVVTGMLVGNGLNVFSPIVHAHPIKPHVAETSFEFWINYDRAFMKKAGALVVAMMDTWEKSRGIQVEIDEFMEMDKPVFYLDLKTMQV